jgi:hypothetical protein
LFVHTPVEQDMGDAKPHTSFLTHRSLQGIPTNHPDKVLTFDRGQHIT